MVDGKFDAAFAVCVLLYMRVFGVMRCLYYRGRERMPEAQPSFIGEHSLSYWYYSKTVSDSITGFLFFGHRSADPLHQKAHEIYILKFICDLCVNVRGSVASRCQNKKQMKFYTAYREASRSNQLLGLVLQVFACLLLVVALAWLIGMGVQRAWEHLPNRKKVDDHGKGSAAAVKKPAPPSTPPPVLKPTLSSFFSGRPSRTKSQ